MLPSMCVWQAECREPKWEAAIVAKSCVASG
jgi:hypothetical protein